MRSITKLTILMGSILIFASCEAPLFDNNTEVTDLDFELGQEFSLQYKNTIYNETEDLSIKFTEIEESRCPADVKCFWAGNAKITFEVTVKENSFDIILNTYPEFDQSTEVDGYRISLNEVAPYPQSSDNPPAKKEYFGKLVVEKAS
jgi:hypothetical protein